MSYPYMTPHSLTFGGEFANFSANVELTPIFVAPRKLTITGFSVVTNAATTLNASSDINACLVNMAAPTTNIAYINCNFDNNMTANVALQGDIVTENMVAGAVLGIYMNMGIDKIAWGEAGSYQIDYVFGSPAGEG